jgi:MFS family permease
MQPFSNRRTAAII